MPVRNTVAALLVALLPGLLPVPTGTAQEGQGARPAGAARKDAVEFARWILDAARVLAEGHIKEPNERELVGWAARGLWEHFNRTTPPELKRLLNRARGMGRRELLALLIEVRSQLGRRPELDDLRDVDIALEGIFKYLEPGASQEPFGEQLGRDIVCRIPPTASMGLLLRPHPPSGMLEVITPILDGPGYRAGIQAGDVITRITRATDAKGRLLPEPIVTPTKGLSVEEAAYQIGGEPNTKVKLTIRGPGAAKEVTVEVTRGRAMLETVLGARRKRDDHWDYLLDPQRKIAYLRLTSFSRDSGRNLERVLRELSKAGLAGLVLDLRSNPGGLLNSAVKVADLFIADGRILSIRSRHGPESVYAGHSDRSYTRFPMVCLINGQSRRATEVVAACLQDHGRAVILGERTPGDTNVRTNLPLRQDACLQFTCAVFKRANGKNLSKLLTCGRDDEDWGVRPDEGFALPLPPQERADLRAHLQGLEIVPRRDGAVKLPPPLRDRQLETALAYLRKQVRGLVRAAA